MNDAIITKPLNTKLVVIDEKAGVIKIKTKMLQ